MIHFAKDHYNNILSHLAHVLGQLRSFCQSTTKHLEIAYGKTWLTSKWPKVSGGIKLFQFLVSLVPLYCSTAFN